MKEQKNNIKDINRYLDNFYATEEVHRLRELIRSEIGSESLDARMKELWIECLASREEPLYKEELLKREAERLLEERVGKAVTPKKRQWKLRLWSRVAASLLLLIVASWTVYYAAKDRHLSTTELTYQEVHVPYGEKKELLLPDGTTVLLNAGSHFSYPDKFMGEERQVKLNGEGFFSVAKDKSHPFVVSSRDLDIKVLGTVFNVKTYEEDELVSVAVRSGKVQVDTDGISSRLTSGEQITLNHRTKDYQKKTVEANSISSWRKGGLFFNETPIADVVRELNRIYNCKVRFEEGQNFNNLIVGEHDNKSIESVLKSIEYTSGIKCRKEGSEYILYK